MSFIGFLGRVWTFICLKDTSTKMALAGAAILSSSVTSAADELPLEDYFMSFPNCYGRTYSLQHQKAHPEQKTVDIAISHFPSRQQLLGMESPYQPYPDTPRFILKLDVWIKGENEGWQTDAYCEPEGNRIACGIECDGGRFYLEGRKDDKLRLTGGTDLDFNQCDAGNRIFNRAPDDKTFLLSPIPLSHCRPH
ncbi:hypothetical protein [Labrenzia sp. PHM005]|uniref:hypothetical protein n=1 Tax=Labrenzia sp. PHM005 TaxID=2590016 RepID=UPI00113FF561|nr:hypothetical protein [Labrenzia sp. PHM005]QDG77571.1 hypothetical protein FJ695_17810 [Labrenzia sp. PHM005]